MKNKNIKIIAIVIAGILGIIITIFLRGIEYQIKKPITDYLFTIMNILIGSVVFALAFTDKFKNNEKVNKKLLFLGIIIFTCGVIMLTLQLV